MTWICAYCGCENENDDRIGLNEPKCKRCKEERIDPEKLKDIRENELEGYLENMRELIAPLQHLRERIESLEDELAGEKCDLREMEAEYASMKEEADQIRESPIHYTKIRIVTKDQKKLFDGATG